MDPYKRANSYKRIHFSLSPMDPYERKKKARKERSEANNRKRTKHITGKTRVSSSSSSDSKLPLDCIAVVLSRLPSASLHRFRCVCKSWDSLVREDRHLASQHLDYSRRSRTNKPGFAMLTGIADSISGRLQWALGYEPFLGGGTYSLNHFCGDALFLKPFLGGGYYSITNSCDGLIGIVGNDSFYIFNPSIRKIEALPRRSPHFGSGSGKLALPSGLGFDASTGDYKVVRMFYRRPKESNKLASIGCEVILLGRNKAHSWRLLDDPPVGGFFYDLPVAVNGSIYWRAERHGDSIGLSFDLSREKFGIVTLPEGSLEDDGFKSCIAEFGGCLGVALKERRQMSIWLLKDPNKSRWVKQYEIDLSGMFYIDSLKPLTFHNGKIVLHNGHWRCCYDPRTRQFDKPDHIISGSILSEIAPYAESIVWPWS